MGGQLTEIEVLKAVDDALTALSQLDARKRVLTWAWEKFLPNVTSLSITPIPAASVTHDAKKLAMKPSEKRTTPKQKTPPIVLVKDLNLRPKGKASLEEYAKAKNPSSLYEKCTLAVHYLKMEIGVAGISNSHIYTCFKQMKWKLPTDLGNTLSYTASHFGWLDTSDMRDIRLTAIGENLIEHDLPRKKTGAKGT